MSRPTRATEIKEVCAGIYGMTIIMEDDLCRAANEGEQQALGQFEQGSMLTAIKHLSNLASWLAEEIEEVEQRMAELAAQRDDRRGGES